MRFTHTAALVTFSFLHSLAQLPDQNDKCAEGSCYPATGDLLIGRAHRLTASSTCGLDGPETYCTLSHQQDQKKCFECDSRQKFDDINHSHSHTIHNVVTTFTPNRLKTWWQSHKGVENVSIQLDLETEFHFTHLIMTFKTVRPTAMVIERSVDYGQSWQIYRYFAFNCAESFPHVPHGLVKQVDEVICDSRYSGIEPLTEGEVIFRLLDPTFVIYDPYSPKIQNLLKITNLRVRMEKFHFLENSAKEMRENLYYALYDMVVRGSCFCYGHASTCTPLGIEETVESMVYGHCVCNHHTTGLNCEECEDFYHDLPWRPAEGRNTNACKRCECNQHSQSCHFDMAVYVSSGNMSGGVCEDCQHNTEGQWCENCKPFFYQHPERDLRDPSVCQPCDCDPLGSLNGGLCDSVTDVLRDMLAGQCRCKVNVEGERCDHCKKQHYGLSEDALGCRPCSCNPLGTLPAGRPCDIHSGSCYCKRLVTGWNCDRCLPEHWGLSHDINGCRPCDCDVGGALNNNCSQETGQCMCKENIVGRRCDQVQSGYYFAALDHYTYEAEEALFEPAVTVFPRSLHVDRKPTWTGSGFVQVPEGETLRFSVYDLPRSMDYNILIRYEPLLPDEWEQVVVSVERPSVTHCTSSSNDEQTVSLHPGSRYVLLASPVCLEQNLTYTVKMYFLQYSSFTYHASPQLLLDSIVLLPDVQDLPVFPMEDDYEMFQKYRCLERSQSVVQIPLTDICRDYVFSVSSFLHNSALVCRCDPHGSLSSVCDSTNGHCQCRPNILGPYCDKCAPATYMFGPSGCRPCNCNPLGSQNPFCHQVSGQCLCVPGAYGRQCGSCKPDHWGFPLCKPCFCNGNSEQCHPVTGACINCREHTVGHHCERCESSYHGNALLSFREPCRPCKCPDGPGSGRQFAESCYKSTKSLQMVCVCNSGYKGPRCDQCAPGHYGNPQVPGGQCHPCQCNGNINLQDPASCDARTGSCVKCLFHTDGDTCQYCARGYFGDALTQSCRKCMCNRMGSFRHSCADGLCNCDSISGQCSCLPGVEGQQCERCAPNTWNFNSGTGCQPCQCHPEHSYSSSCDLLSGQCSCRGGFGGRTCEECRELFWGNPKAKCYACDCDLRGTAIQQCDRTNGHCFCIKGVSGPRCDSCGRGYYGTFPDCEQCHGCFSVWDVTVRELTNHTQRLIDTVQELKDLGSNSPYKGTILNLEDGIKRLRLMLEDDKIHQILSHAQMLGQKANETASHLRASLDRAETDLRQVSGDHSRAVQNLHSLMEEMKLMQELFQDKQRLVVTMKHSDFRGAMDGIREYYSESNTAESRVNKSVSHPSGEVKQSARMRGATDVKLDATEQQYKLMHQLHVERLERIKSELEARDLSRLSRQVCGGAAGLQGCGNCGGLGCVSADGEPHCGGEGCETVVSRSEKALERAENFDNEILLTLRETEKLNKMVSDAQERANKAKLSAEDVSLRANQSKAQVQQTNEELRDLIQQIRDFLTHGTDLSRIESVAEEVLKMTFPVLAGSLKNVTTQIQRRVSRLGGVDEVLAQTADQIHTAESLLRHAQAASKSATALRHTAEEIRLNMEDAERTQINVSKKFRSLETNMNVTKQQISSVQSRIETAEFTLSSSTGRFLDLERNVEELRWTTQNVSSSIDQVQRQSEDISEETDQTENDVDSFMQPRYQLVKVLMDQKGTDLSDARHRAEQLRNEAKELLKDATTKLQRLRELERLFVINQQTLKEKTRELDGLEHEAREVLQELNQKTAVYSTCA